MNPLLLPVSPQNLVLSARKVFWAKVGGFVSLNDKQICIVLATAHCSYLHLYLECKVYRPLQALCYIWIWIYLWLGKINAHRSVCFSVFRVFFWALCKCLVLVDWCLALTSTGLNPPEASSSLESVYYHCICTWLISFWGFILPKDTTFNLLH